ncbi:hypothetical protein Q8A64_14740 [Oxalobacteraceae bacterium R-40]|uniref:Uncharacterized protein n=1 Tax=Keguizhuia sedimenti TaxID=3064264 RepID=A0ABU1BTS6_9BURK|nr:hypothetical protein [Oxalobacteraceae bacterium R-40]
MSTDQNTLAGLENQAFSLMARLHVIIRRETGRVTDIEYMRIDPVYCRHVLNMAMSMPNDDLPQICEKLQEVYFGPEGLFVRTPPKPSLLSRLTNTAAEVQTASVPANTIAETMQASRPSDARDQHHIELNEAVEKAYIGRLR